MGDYLSLGVNIDHVATVRQARYAPMPDAHNAEPCLVQAARECEAAGARGITVHLREDRRHIQERDVRLLRNSVRTNLNMEMGNTEEILAIALELKPNDVCIVPENRREITTEGGLDAAGLHGSLAPTVDALHTAGIRVSLFIDPDIRQIDASHQLGARIVELHTGAFANASGKNAETELERLRLAARHANQLGIQVNAGHGINYANIAQIRTIPELRELNIGHAIVSRALFTGLARAVSEMLEAMRKR